MVLQGKLGLIFGVANHRSIGWGIAQALAGAGARLAFTYQDRFADSVRNLAATIPGSICIPCDVQSDEQIEAVMGQVDEEFGGLDILVHSVAFAPRDALEGSFLGTSRESFRTALDISAYSLIPMVRAAMPLMEKRGGGSVLTMTYLGSERAVPGYNVMGVAKAALEACVRYLAFECGPKNVRVNAISAGPVRTTAARGIKGFSKMEDYASSIVPLRRSTEAAEIGQVGLFLCSQMSRGITGEIVYSDSGYHILGLTAPDLV